MHEARKPGPKAGQGRNGRPKRILLQIRVDPRIAADVKTGNPGDFLEAIWDERFPSWRQRPDPTVL